VSPVAHDYTGKRLLDIIGAMTALMLTSPILVIAAIAVKLTSRGPVLYSARRVGQHGKQITVHKFRSMRTGVTGTNVTATNDPHITRVGRVLRGAKLDELPQFWDVLVGSMSIVGPRPEDSVYVNTYSRTEAGILDWKPGITSPASIAFRHEEDLLANADDLDAAYAQVSRDKIALDLAYFGHATLVSDLRVIGRTVAAVFDRNT
jgi:lipopolysaccharide/colanic/teichoic acid biosynthesis glycosyltransferase